MNELCTLAKRYVVGGRRWYRWIASSYDGLAGHRLVHVCKFRGQIVVT